MMPSDRLDRRLPQILDEISQPRRPDYFDDLVGLSARTRQRPAWTLLERWLPMVDIARQPAYVRHVPWRPLAVMALILLLIAASLAFLVGSQHRVPAPFGLAGNGLVVYAKDGDIFTANPTTGASTAIVEGPGTDVNPVWSREGTSIAFERSSEAGSKSGAVYVARPDGSNLIQVTSQPLSGITGYDFSPDGTQLLISADRGGVPGMFIAATDGSGIHPLDVGRAAQNAAWLPPSGSEISFTDSDHGDGSGGNGGIYLVSSHGGAVRQVVADQRFQGIYRGHPVWSPDGSRIAFGEWCELDCSTGKPLTVNGATVQIHLLNADGSGDTILPDPAGDVQAPESWSNDGAKLLVIRGSDSDGGPPAQPVVVPIDGGSTGVEITYPGGMNSDPTTVWQWAPDDSSILGTPTSDTSTSKPLGQVLLDPVKGTYATLSWDSPTEPSWQRVAP